MVAFGAPLWTKTAGQAIPAAKPAKRMNPTCIYYEVSLFSAMRKPDVARMHRASTPQYNSVRDEFKRDHHGGRRADGCPRRHHGAAGSQLESADKARAFRRP